MLRTTPFGDVIGAGRRSVEVLVPISDAPHACRGPLRPRARRSVTTTHAVACSSNSTVRVHAPENLARVEASGYKGLAPVRRPEVVDLNLAEDGDRYGSSSLLSAVVACIERDESEGDRRAMTRPLVFAAVTLRRSRLMMPGSSSRSPIKGAGVHSCGSRSAPALGAANCSRCVGATSTSNERPSPYALRFPKRAPALSRRARRPIAFASSRSRRPRSKRYGGNASCRRKIVSLRVKPSKMPATLSRSGWRFDSAMSRVRSVPRTR